MKNQFKTILLTGAIAACSYAAQVQASVYYWQNTDKTVSASFSDAWKTVHNQRDGDVLTVHAPGVGHFATCSINIKADNRFAIYPHKFSENIRNVALTSEYWDEYFANVDAPQYHTVLHDAGLGKGFATMALLSFESVPDNESAPRVFKRGIAFASLYNNAIHTVECSAEATVYHQWHDRFLSFVKSVDFKQPTNYAYTGYYRNFLEDCILKVRGPRWTDDTYH